MLPALFITRGGVQVEMLIFGAGTKGGKTTAGTSIKGEDQVKNMQTGAADHLNMGFRK